VYDLNSQVQDYVNNNAGRIVSKQSIIRMVGKLGFDYLYNNNHLQITDLEATSFMVKL